MIETDNMETRFLDLLEEGPAASYDILVYADWLEEQGEDLKASAWRMVATSDKEPITHQIIPATTKFIWFCNDINCLFKTKMINDKKETITKASVEISVYRRLRDIRKNPCDCHAYAEKIWQQELAEIYLSILQEQSCNSTPMVG